MNKNLRTPVIAGNWKMNKTPLQTVALIGEMRELIRDASCGVVLCVPFVDLKDAVAAARGSQIQIGAQNMHFEKSGAYTGEISGEMLKDSGARYVIIGHSERRQYFAETDETVNLKVKAALGYGLKPILCVGETLRQREEGVTDDLISKQIGIALSGIDKDGLKEIIIAYEPIWAIGTGKTATAAQAQQVCRGIRDVLSGLYGAEGAQGAVILYGGSMNPQNAKELLSMPDVDGGLIGGASLKAADFAAIVSAVSAG